MAGALRFLAGKLRERPDSVVAYFPQGRIWPSFRRPLGFERGIELFARRLPVVTLPVGLHAEPLNRVAPTFFVSIGPPTQGTVQAEDLERSVEEELDAIHGFLSAHGEDALRRWPDPGTALPRAGAPR